MEIVSFVDLDDTLFQTLPKCPDKVMVHPAARARDGKPLSFMTPSQKLFFQKLHTLGPVIPVTARNHDAFRRVELPFAHVSILDFGGVILEKNGNLDLKWDRIIRQQALSNQPLLEEVQKRLEKFIDDTKLGARSRIIWDFDLPLYVVIKHPGAHLKSLSTIQEEFLPQCDLSLLHVHRNHNNLSLVPRFLGKDKAVEYVLQNYFPEQPRLILGVADSISDLPFLNLCDFMILPRQSQLAGCLGLPNPPRH